PALETQHSKLITQNSLQGDSMYTEQLTQAFALCAPVNPQVINNTNKTAGPVDMQAARRALLVLEIGAVTGGGAITAQLVESNASDRSEEHTSELQSLAYLVCRLLLEKKKKKNKNN